MDVYFWDVLDKERENMKKERVLWSGYMTNRTLFCWNKASDARILGECQAAICTPAIFDGF